MSLDSLPSVPSSAVFAEAAEWMADCREGYLDEAGLRRFHEWLRRSPEHIQAYLEAVALWEDIPALAAGMEIDADAIVARARAQKGVISLSPGPRSIQAGGPSVAPRRGVWRRAALWAGLVPIAALLLWWQHSSQTLYTTQIGEQRSISLEDGSVIELGARSSVRVHMRAAERDIELIAGQALFRVAKDTRRPFVVSTNNARVRAVGTQFDVDRHISGTTVTVFEGRVAVESQSNPQHSPTSAGQSGNSSGLSRRARDSASAGSRAAGTSEGRPRGAVSGDGLTAGRSGSATIFLAAGEQLTVSASVDEAPRPHAVDAAGSAWADRTLAFDNAPLSDVVEEFNRYNSRQIVLTDPALGSLRISGVFAAGKPSSLLRFLEEQLQLEVVAKTDEIAVSSRANKSSPGR